MPLGYGTPAPTPPGVDILLFLPRETDLSAKTVRSNLSGLQRRGCSSMRADKDIGNCCGVITAAKEMIELPHRR